MRRILAIAALAVLPQSWTPDSHFHDGAHINSGTVAAARLPAVSALSGAATDAQRKLAVVGVATDQSQSTVNFADVTGLTFAVSASTTYRFACEISYTTAATTTALQLAINGPASPTAVRYGVDTATTATAPHYASQNAYDTNTNPATGGGATALTARIAGSLENGSNAGTLAIRYRSEVAASAVTVLRGSFCTVVW